MARRFLPSLILAGACLGGSAHAAVVTMNANDALGTTSLNAIGHWDNGALPTAGNTYFTAAFTVRTPTDNGATHVFAGDSLTIDNGGRLLGKSTGTQTVAFTNGTGLILNGGTLLMGGAPSDTFTLTVTGNITVAATSLIGALGATANNSASFETLDLAATISGSAALSVAGTSNAGANTGVVKLSAANPYTGIITVRQPGNGFIASATNRLLQLNHRDALRFATLELSTTAENGLSFAASANTGNFRLGALDGLANQTLTDTAGNPVTIEIGGSGKDSFYSGILRGSGSIVKTGTGTVTLSGQHTFTGNTTVSQGTLSIATASLNNNSTITIATGANLDLGHTGVDVVKALVLNGVSQPDGVYTELTPGGFITGPGSIQVNSGAPLPEDVFMTGNDVGAVLVTSFNGDVGHWSLPGTPTVPNRYFTGAFTLRTPALTATGDGGTFGGSSLSIDAGGRFLGKAGANLADSTVVETITVNNLILNGGLMDQAGAPNSNASLVVAGNVNVAANSVLGALGAGANDAATSESLNFTATISGSAGLTIAGTANGGGNTGIVRFSAANPYSGTITILQPGSGFISSATNRLFQLNHRDAVQNATLALSTTAANGISFAAAVNTGAFRAGGITGTASQVLADTAGAPVTLQVGGSNASSTYDGALTGSGSLVKAGTGTLTLNGLNSYTGSTTVSGGTLTLAQSSLADTSTVTVAAGAVLNLTHGATDLVGSLILNGVAQAAGTYDSTNSGGRITGTGKIQVAGGASGFASFMDGFPGLTIAQKAANADPDGDGISNLVEYALNGMDPTVPGSLPAAVNGTLTFTKRAAAVTNGDVAYAFESSATLGQAPSPWTVVTPTTNDATTISYTIPTAGVRNFVRLRVIKN